MGSKDEIWKYEIKKQPQNETDDVSINIIFKKDIKYVFWTCYMDVVINPISDLI